MQNIDVPLLCFASAATAIGENTAKAPAKGVRLGLFSLQEHTNRNKAVPFR
jgi:hypothetical protein